MNRQILPAILCAIVTLCSLPAARAAEADVTGLVPTIWLDFETKPSASDLKSANKGSASVSFAGEGTATYQAGVTNGWAIDTSKYTPYSKESNCSTPGNPITVSAVMTLGTNPNGITLNVRMSTGDLIIRRGATAGSLVVGWGEQPQVSSHTLTATFTDGDAAYHLVSVVGTSTGTELYVDGVLAGSSTEFTPWSSSVKVTQMQFGAHLIVGAGSGEARLGGCIDDLRIHDAALSAAQIKAIAVEYGLALRPDALDVSGDPQDWGTVVPDYGTTSGLSQGNTVSCSATGSETESTKIIPTGYSLYSVASDGEETLVEESTATSFMYTHGSDTGRLVWHWAQSNMVTVASGANGSVSQGGWVGYGEPFSLTAAPDSGYKFGYWTGDTAGIDILSASTVIPSVTAPVSLAAEFVVAGADVTVQYVSPSGSDDNDGYFESSPKKTIAAAVAALDPVSSASGRTCTVHVAPGRYPISSHIAVTNAVRIIGCDEDPAQVVVSNASSKTVYGETHRLFWLADAQAMLSGMTLEKGFVNIAGGKGGGGVYAAAGVVSNCVIRDCSISQSSASSAYGGGVFLEGGSAVLTHCIVSNCTAEAKQANWAKTGAAGVYAGSGRVENCLVVDCRDPHSAPTFANMVGGIMLGTAGASAVNCTVVGCHGSHTGGILANNASALVRNCVAFCCEKRIKVNDELAVTTVPFGGTATLFDHCASDAAETYDQKGSILGLTSAAFKNYANGDYTPVSGGSLYNKGANYEGMASVDLAGNPRKVGKGVDIGCYEASSSALMIIVR